MEFFVLLLLIIVQCNEIRGNANIQELTAVTSLPNREFLELYNQILESTPDDRVNPSPPNIDDKKRICKDITGSGYFHGRGEIPVDFDEAYKVLVESKVQEHNPMFARVLENYTRIRAAIFWSQMTYTHPTKPIRVELSQDRVSENVFECLTRNESNENIFNLYYISDAYNINLMPDLSSALLPGRFVFSALRSGNDDAGAFVALAEESAFAFPAPEHDVEFVYMRMRTFYTKVSKDADRDPVCGLTKSKKIRICASAMTSDYFQDKLRYVPESWGAGEPSYEGKCEKGRVLFESVPGSAEQSAKNVFEEWMLPCPVEPLQDGVPSFYYVSRTHESHYAYVFSRTTPTSAWHRLENVSKNIPPIYENKCVPPYCLTTLLQSEE